MTYLPTYLPTYQVSQLAQGLMEKLLQQQVVISGSGESGRAVTQPLLSLAEQPGNNPKLRSAVLQLMAKTELIQNLLQTKPVVIVR